MLWKLIIFRTLYKQGPYGGHPIICRSLIITPGSLVKVSLIFLHVFSIFRRNKNMPIWDRFYHVEILSEDDIRPLFCKVSILLNCVCCQNWCKEFRKWLSSERLSVFAVSANNTVEVFYFCSRYFYYKFIAYYPHHRCRYGVTGRTLDLRSTGLGFKSYSGQMLHNNLGQVVHTYVPLSPSSITWYRPRGGDALWLGRQLHAWRKVMALDGRLIVTCGLTACTPGSVLGPTLCNEYGKPFYSCQWQLRW